MKAPRSYSKRTVAIGVAIAVFAFAGFGYWKWQQASLAAKAKPTYTTLDARVVWTSDLFRIANVDTRTWYNCQFVLNRSDTKPGYIFFRERVQSREVLQIAHEVFSDPAGHPYQYKKDPPTSLYIRCEDVNNSVGLFSGKYTAGQPAVIGN